MKRNIMTVLFAMFAVVQTMGQTYDNLWKQAEAMQQKDLPKSEIAILQRIAKKATLAKDYGQLLAAEMRQVALWGSISSDSIAPKTLLLEAQAVQEKDPMLQAVRYAALGKLCSILQISESELDGKSQEYFCKALANPELLAQHFSTEYVPLTLKGMDGTTFNNDMLHLIGFEADTKEAYQQMYTYYNKVGNRGAACLCAFEITQKDRQEDVREVRKSKYLNTIDSLIHVYQDVPQAGELAVEHYRFMEGATDAKPLDKINYINYALNRWGGWSRMNVLRNALKKLSEPYFSIDRLQQVSLPNHKQMLDVEVRNLQSLKLSISRLDITADNDYDVSDEATYKMLLKKTTTLHQKDIRMTFYGHPNYELVKDSVEIPGLPLGAYLMEITSDNTSMKPERRLFYVSDLALMSQQLPDDSHRYVVVSATTGQPIAGAKIQITNRRYDNKTGKDKRTVLARLTTDENGEASYKNVDGDILVTTNNDKYTPAQWTYLSRTRYHEPKDSQLTANIYTDRAIYRPGQTVHVSVVRFIKEKNLDAKVDANADVKLELRDAKSNIIASQQAMTDAYGTATVDFVLPKEAETGRYSLRVSDGEKKPLTAYGSFQVEEYKRPTFEVTFPKVNEKYTWGDTVVVKASAKTYAGVPVQGAKAIYQVTRRNSLWWWGNTSSNKLVMEGEATTREDGTFDVEIPLEPAVALHDVGEMAEFMRKARFYSFDVMATVVDVSGETHSGEMSLPLGTKSTAFSSDMPARIEADSLKQVVFSYRNASGMEIASQLHYRIDKGEWTAANSNTAIILPKMISGVHHLEAICERDTLEQKFVLFSMSDTRPMEKTVHWNYQTAQSFSQDGKPVYVQIGSSENGVHIVYSIIAGNKLLEKGTWEIGDSIVTLPFTYKPEYASGIVINYCFVKKGECYTNRMSICRPLPEKKLNVAWKSFRNRLTPGQKEEWTLTLTTPDGKPAKAQLMSILYDKSLEQLMKHTWQMYLGFHQNLPNCYWRNNLDHMVFSVDGSYPTKYYDEEGLEVDRFNDSYLGSGLSYSISMPLMGAFSYKRREMSMENATLAESRTVDYNVSPKMANSVMMDKQAAVAPEEMVAEALSYVDDDMVRVTGSVNDAVNASLDQVQLRENMTETAFFYPALESDAKGNVSLKFTLPESITTWKFMGLAHDKEMRNGMLTDEVVAKKTVMVQPNLPRFLREGDKARLVAKVFNTSDKKVSGDARMQMIDPETNKVIWQKNQKYSIDAEGTVTLSFDVQNLKEGTYINKVVVAGNGYSDGEQHYLPVLSDKELVVNTLPITLHEAGKKDFDLSRLFLNKDGKQVKADKDTKVTVEYTNNPSWLMMKALPAVSNPTEEDAISLMAAVYANSISRHIQKSLKVNAKDINDANSLTPSADTLQQKVDKYVNLLKKLQNEDGSFSWWKGMNGCRYITTEVAEMMVRLDAIVGKQSTTTSKMLSSAINYLRQQTAREVREMKAEEARNKKYDATPSEQALYYLYIISMDGTKLNASSTADKTYLLGKLEKMTGKMTIYGKAKSAVILAKNQKPEVANDYLQSIEEYSVYREEMGRYYDTHKAYYSWRNYKIPTEVAAIEALQILNGNTQTIEEMQRWLLMSKRTQAWDTPVNTVDAVFAFMNGNEQNWSRKAENAVIKLDDKLLPMPKDSTTLGYMKVEYAGKNASHLSIDKKSSYTSWGAVYAEFKQPIAEIASSESGIKITRKVASKAKVGDKVKVTLTINADRDYDFVKVIDRRAACLEPVGQISGYQWGLGCYVSPRDYTTNFYFERLSKGKHVVELEYYVDREGDYRSGSCTVECTYSPEFGGRTEGYQMKVKNEE